MEERRVWRLKVVFGLASIGIVRAAAECEIWFVLEFNAFRDGSLLVAVKRGKELWSGFTGWMDGIVLCMDEDRVDCMGVRKGAKVKATQ